MDSSEQWKVWSKVALNSFGGPAGQITVIHKLLVEEKKVISEERFLHALNFCMLLPGPEAQQLATYIGWLISGWRGGLMAGGLFILPGFISILLLSFLYVLYNDLPLVQGLFYGMKPAIIAIVIAALLKISKRSLSSPFYWCLAGLAFTGLYFFKIPFPVVIVTAAVLGIVRGKKRGHHKPEETIPEIVIPSLRSTIKTLLAWLLIWVIPIILVLIFFGKDSTFHSINVFFSKVSLFTFGGAYAVLNYVAQQAVGFGWLQGTEMLDGLGMAETTPGPLIQVVQFVGFMGALRSPDMSSPFVSAFIGSVLSTWMTYAPCFLWIFVLAPYVEYIRGHKIFANALMAITSAVVGVIVNLSLWFVLKSLFTHSEIISFSVFNFELPIWESIDLWATGICLIALSLQFVLKKDLFVVLGISTLIGMTITLGRALGYL